VADTSLVADRFLYLAADGWIDLATGDSVEVVVSAADDPAPWPPDEVVDAGPLGVDRRFVARLRTPPADGPPPDAAIVRRLAGRVASAAEAAGAGVHLVRAAPGAAGQSLALGRAIGHRLREMGIVPVRADLRLPAEVVERLAGRHLAILCYGAAGDAGAVEWIRRLTGRPWRRHLLVDLRPPGLRARRLADAAHASARAREHAAPYAPAGSAPAADHFVSAARARADACLRRGRTAAAERWLRAAVGGARRRGDDDEQVSAGERLFAEHVARGDWARAERTGLELLSHVRAWHARADAAALLGRAFVARGELGRAEALLSAVVAEAGVLGQPVPSRLRVRRAQVRFWQGRFEEASRDVSDLDDACSETCAWRALVAWACAEPAPAAGAPAVPAGRDWPASIFTAGLARACAVEALIGSGHPADARRVLDAETARAAPSPLEGALFNWLRARCGRDAAAAAAATAFIRQSGAKGITRWGLGRTGMHLLHAVPALLQIMHDEDEHAAVLVRACRWLREATGARAAGILTADAGRVVSGEGLGPADLQDPLLREALRSERPHGVAEGADAVVTVPVRSGGVTIGLVVGRGDAGLAGTLAEAAAAVASLCAPSLRARLDEFAQRQAAQSLAPELLGRSPAIQALREGIARAAETSFPVLIEGESGTGKELVARAVHRLSARRDRHFCAINCAALADELVEAELFGHTRGAFTGAVGPRAGLFEEAHGGTLFLDEVGDLSARAQAKLLRVLQEREIRRVGENIARPIDVRVVAATNRPLAAGGLFRDDLRFRLAVVRFRLPPLRERLEDVPLLADACWRRLTAETGKRVVLGPDALAALGRYPWPGNVRELQNAMAALIVQAPTRGRVSARQVADVLAAEEQAAGVLPLGQARASFERQLVRAALARHAGSRTEAARELGLSRQGLTRAIKRLGVAPPGERGAA